jgi:hypothetical protein
MTGVPADGDPPGEEDASGASGASGTAPNETPGEGDAAGAGGNPRSPAEPDETGAAAKDAADGASGATAEGASGPGSGIGIDESGADRKCAGVNGSADAAPPATPNGDSVAGPPGRPNGDSVAGPRPCRDASTRPDDSASPAANRTSAAARPVGHGSGSPQTGQMVIPSRGPAPPACAWATSCAVRASTLSGFTYVVDAILFPIPRRSPAGRDGAAAPRPRHASAQVHRVARGSGPVSRNR